MKHPYSFNRFSKPAIHILGSHYAFSNDDDLTSAARQKIHLFPEVIKRYGWWVIEYGNETLNHNASEHVQIFSKEKLDELSQLHFESQILDGEFNKVLLQKLKERIKPHDIICHVHEPNLEVYKAIENCFHIEMSVDYNAHDELPFRIYASSAWLHWSLGKMGRDIGSHYNWVIPPIFDADQWHLSNRPEDYALCIAPLSHRSGINTLTEIALRLPRLTIHVYGSGDTSPWAGAPSNLIFKGPSSEIDKKIVISKARCLLIANNYVGSSGQLAIQSQLCGTPVIATNYGANIEHIEDGENGYLCQTLADWIVAIESCQKLDRPQISATAKRKYSKDEIGRRYDSAFNQLRDVFGPAWYSPVSRKFVKVERIASFNKSHIWIFMPYFGALPNYFQLYLNSLRKNSKYISVIFITDNDMSIYDLPENFHIVKSDLNSERKRFCDIINTELKVTIQPDDIIQYPYKIADFKIMYPYAYEGLGRSFGVRDTDFVGWGDCDLIYGDLEEFLFDIDEYDILGGMFGHLTAFRNQVEFRRLFISVEDILNLLTTPTHFVTDEIAFRKRLFELVHEKSLKVFHTQYFFCDIVPEVFMYLFNRSLSEDKIQLFDSYNSDKDIQNLEYSKNGKLRVFYTNGDSRSVIYCHLQKRKMRIEIESDERGYRIVHDAFLSVTA